MSRYVDVDALKRKKRFDSVKQKYIVWMSDVYQAPSIDICFCKECISADEKPIADGRYWCNSHGCYMRFCSDGEREGE